jgi:hypothetical protein
MTQLTNNTEIVVDEPLFAEEVPVNIQEQDSAVKTDNKVTPLFGSDKWQEYVYSLLRSDELVNEKPNCSGLRRVVERLIGPIVSQQIVKYTPPTTYNGIATVVVGIKIHVINPSHPILQGSLDENYVDSFLYMEEIADVHEANTKHPYSLHPSATAATRAESRILRKMLRLNTITIEETEDFSSTLLPQSKTGDLISDSQMNVINLLCQRCNVNELEFINSGSKKYTNINEINRETAIKMIENLNEIQKGKAKKPDNVGVYKAAVTQS